MQPDLSEQKAMLGNRIRTLRGNKGLTQQELAERCSLNYKYLGAIERGERNPTFENLVKIAAGLEISLQGLFTIEHETPNAEALKARIAELLSGTDENNVRLIYKIIGAVVG